MFMRQVLPSSPGVSRGVRSRELRREPRPRQSTWSRETLRALFPFAWRHVKWVFAYLDDQDPPGGERSTQPPLNSTPRHTYSGLTVGTFMIRHGLQYVCVNNLQLTFLCHCFKEEWCRLKMGNINGSIYLNHTVIGCHRHLQLMQHNMNSIPYYLFHVLNEALIFIFSF